MSEKREKKLWGDLTGDVVGPKGLMDGVWKQSSRCKHFKRPSCTSTVVVYEVQTKIEERRGNQRV